MILICVLDKNFFHTHTMWENTIWTKRKKGKLNILYDGDFVSVILNRGSVHAQGGATSLLRCRWHQKGAKIPSWQCLGSFVGLGASEQGSRLGGGSGEARKRWQFQQCFWSIKHGARASSHKRAERSLLGWSHFIFAEVSFLELYFF